MKNFSTYSLIGVLNTALHWIVFYSLVNIEFSQSTSNLVAFIIAVNFSFIMNARFNFKSEVNKKRYVLFISGMGTLSYFVGVISDENLIPPLFTLIVFSAISLFFGYIYSKFVVFR